MAEVSDATRRRYAYDLRRLCDCSGTEGFVRLPDLLDELGIGQDFYVSSSAVEHLADLMDRPTTTAVSLGEGEFCACNLCGWDGWSEAAAVTRFCPHCGAEVVDG